MHVSEESCSVFVYPPSCTAANNAPAPSGRRELQTQEGIKREFPFHGDLTLDMPHNVGEGPHGNRQVIRVVSGTVDGPRIKGTTLPMSGDWLLLRNDGVGELNVRSTIKTDDDHLIYMH